jgi:hypothetical protein
MDVESRILIACCFTRDVAALRKSNSGCKAGYARTDHSNGGTLHLPQATARCIQPGTMPVMRILSETPRFAIISEYESTFVIDRTTGSRYDLGDHYGDATCALIAPDESWFIAGGEGVTLTRMGEDYREFLRTPEISDEVVIRYESEEKRNVEFTGVQRSADPPPCVEMLRLTGSGMVEIISADPRRRWLLDPSTVSIRRLA